MYDDEPLLILGTSDFSVVVADIAEDAGYTVAGFVENRDRSRVGSGYGDRRVSWHEDLPELAATHQVIGGMGTTRRSEFIDQAMAVGMRFATVIHPAAHVSRRASVGPGALISPGAVIAGYSVIGPHVVLNRGAMVGHHTSIGAYCSIHPGAQVAGRCSVGAATWVGIGAVVRDHTRVGTGVVVGAGAIVIADVPDRTMVVGNPARVVREAIEPK